MRFLQKIGVISTLWTRFLPGLLSNKTITHLNSGGQTQVNPLRSPAFRYCSLSADGGSTWFSCC